MPIPNSQTPLVLLQFLALASPTAAILGQVFADRGRSPGSATRRHRRYALLNFYCLLYTGLLLSAGFASPLLATFPPWPTIAVALLLAFSSGTLVGALYEMASPGSR